METLYIWYSDRFDEGWGWLLPEQPEEHCATYDMAHLQDVTPEMAAELQEEYKASGEYWEEFLSRKKIEYDWLNEYTPADMLCRDMVVYDATTGEIGTFDGLDTFPAFSWWDGHNSVWESLSEDDGMAEEVIEVLPNPVNIDRWDGQNLTTWGTGHNGYIYRTPDPNKFVLVCRTQWQGGKDEATIMTAAELKEWAKDYREEEIKSILGE